ncbi:HAD-IIA family hydrolase [Jannaschia sp. R86511]|uniref:HAD-IIA family hydrolase n=1 Tax=Jannaschia sp. R86511 TaxID=3093853 RepID=UPI0036D37D41
MRSPEHDALLLDLDGVVYAGDGAVPGAPEALARLRADGVALRFVTNNAFRTPQQVADKLVSVGVAATAEEVLASPRAAVGLLRGRFGLDDGDRVAVAGGQGLLQAVTEAGLTAEHVSRLDGTPAALVQGFSPATTWEDLATASRLVAQGVPWVATNLDATIPTAWGIAPGNGLLVRAVAEAAGRRPDAVAGKPGPHLFTVAAQSCGAVTPLVVGDRLDTDVAGGRAAGQRTALVLTGVHGVLDALRAEPSHRPDRLLQDLGDLWPGPGHDAADALTRGLHRAWAELDAGLSDDERDEALSRWSRQLSPAPG